jgi:hypothetical protein
MIAEEISSRTRSRSPSGNEEFQEVDEETKSPSRSVNSPQPIFLIWRFINSLQKRVAFHASVQEPKNGIKRRPKSKRTVVKDDRGRIVVIETRRRSNSETRRRKD